MSELLRVENLRKFFPITGGVFRRVVGQIQAVKDVSFVLNTGETLGIVGESGCGKSTLGRTLARLYEPTNGEIFFRGANFSKLPANELKKARRHMQMIFQDPYASLNPRRSVSEILEEPFNLHQIGTKAQRREWVKELLQTVGLRPEALNRYPHEFSGGQRQRIGIARAIALKPELIICDEAVSALDVSIQAQILNLLVKLQREMKLTYIFISHDLGVVKYICDRVAVMYLGQIVEISDAKELYAKPSHPYTQALLSSVPKPDPRQRSRGEILEGDVPSPSKPPSGCRFHTRCKYVTEICKQEEPLLRVAPQGSASHLAACHNLEKINSSVKQ